MALHVRIDVPPFPAAIEAVAEGLVRLNMVLFEFAEDKGVSVPELYESGIVYRREKPGNEWWESALDALGVVTMKSGDCEDLASYRAAELRYFEGEPARVVILTTPRGSFHAVVRREDGTIEDPSRICLDIEAERKGKGR